MIAFNEPNNRPIRLMQYNWQQSDWPCFKYNISGFRIFYSNWPKILSVGSWRNHREPMQIVSGPTGKTKIHFEAPPSDIVLEALRDSEI